MNEEKGQNFDEDFQMGLKLLIGSYEGKFQNMESDIASLNELINQKQDIIDDLEKRIKFLMMENKEINEQKAKLYSENQYLLEVIENLTKEAKKLEKFKKNILTSIECENEGSVNPVSLQASNIDKFKYIPKKIGKMNYNVNPSKSIQSLSINSTERNYNTNILNTLETNKSIERDNKMNMNINTGKNVDLNEKKEFKLDNEKIDELIEKLNESLNKRINSDESRQSKSYKESKTKDNLDNKIFDLKKKFKEKKNSNFNVSKNERENMNISLKATNNCWDK